MLSTRAHSRWMGLRWRALIIYAGRTLSLFSWYQQNCSVQTHVKQQRSFINTTMHQVEGPPLAGYAPQQPQQQYAPQQQQQVNHLPHQCHSCKVENFQNPCN